MSSQAVQGQWWSHTLDSLAGQVVGSCIRWWYKRLCNGLLRGDAYVDRERSPDRPLVARANLTCYEWLCPRLSGASGAQPGRSPTSQAGRASTLVVWVAAGCLAARLLRYFGSREKISFFGLSGAATRLTPDRFIRPASLQQENTSLK